MNRLNYLLVAATLSLTAGVSTARALPPDKKIIFEVLEDPDDPTSAVVFTQTLRVHAVSATTTTVSWSIVEAKFDDLTSGDSWLAENPTIDTSDGYWTVQHADVTAPALWEFSEPPVLEGLAEPQSGTTGELYFLFGAEETPSPPSGSDPPTTQANYHFESFVNSSGFIIVSTGDGDGDVGLDD